MVRVHLGPPQPHEEAVWGYSSAGRAPALQAGGHRFEPDYLHHSLSLERESEQSELDTKYSLG